MHNNDRCATLRRAGGHLLTFGWILLYPLRILGLFFVVIPLIHLISTVKKMFPADVYFILPSISLGLIFTSLILFILAGTLTYNLDLDIDTDEIIDREKEIINILKAEYTDLATLDIHVTETGEINVGRGVDQEQLDPTKKAWLETHLKDMNSVASESQREALSNAGTILGALGVFGRGIVHQYKQYKDGKQQFWDQFGLTMMNLIFLALMLAPFWGGFLYASFTGQGLSPAMYQDVLLYFAPFWCVSFFVIGLVCEGTHYLRIETEENRDTVRDKQLQKARDCLVPFRVLPTWNTDATPIRKMDDLIKKQNDPLYERESSTGTTSTRLAETETPTSDWTIQEKVLEPDDDNQVRSDSAVSRTADIHLNISALN